MSANIWRLRRLAAMSPAEIARRAALAVRDRTLPPAYMRWSPDQAFERLFPAGWAQTLGGSRLERLVHVPAGAGAVEPGVGAELARRALERVRTRGAARRPTALAPRPARRW